MVSASVETGAVLGRGALAYLFFFPSPPAQYVLRNCASAMSFRIAVSPACGCDRWLVRDRLRPRVFV